MTKAAYARRYRRKLKERLLGDDALHARLRTLKRDQHARWLAKLKTDCKRWQHEVAKQRTRSLKSYYKRKQPKS